MILQDRLSFSAEEHEYRWDGRRVPSVTGILSTMIPTSGHRGGVLYKELGTIVHRWIAEHFNDDEPPPPPSIETAIRGFRSFRDMLGLEPRELELSLYHPELYYAGTVDCVAWSRATEGFWIIDWKTWGGRWWSPLQIAAYGMLAERANAEWGGATLAVVGLNLKTPKPAIADAGAAETWLALLRVHHWANACGGKLYGHEANRV